MVENLATRKKYVGFSRAREGPGMRKAETFIILHPISNVSALRCCPLECQIADLVSYPQKTNKIPPHLWPVAYQKPPTVKQDIISKA